MARTVGVDRRACPCGGGDPYDHCCGAVHAHLRSAERAEQVMRARYAAYVLGLDVFLLESWHPSTRPPLVTFDRHLRWTGLAILTTVGGGRADVTGEVGFVARYERLGTPGSLAERSRFDRLPSGWVYVDGLVA